MATAKVIPMLKWATILKRNKETKMQKDEPSGGRDAGPMPGPEKIATPITGKQMSEQALSVLIKGFEDLFGKNPTPSKSEAQE